MLEETKEVFTGVTYTNVDNICVSIFALGFKTIVYLENDNMNNETRLLVESALMAIKEDANRLYFGKLRINKLLSVCAIGDKRFFRYGDTTTSIMVPTDANRNELMEAIISKDGSEVKLPTHALLKRKFNIDALNLLVKNGDNDAKGILKNNYYKNVFIVGAEMIPALIKNYA